MRENNVEGNQERIEIERAGSARELLGLTQGVMWSIIGSESCWETMKKAGKTSQTNEFDLFTGTDGSRGIRG